MCTSSYTFCIFRKQKISLNKKWYGVGIAYIREQGELHHMIAFPIKLKHSFNFDNTIRAIFFSVVGYVYIHVCSFQQRMEHNTAEKDMCTVVHTSNLFMQIIFTFFNKKKIEKTQNRWSYLHVVKSLCYCSLLHYDSTGLWKCHASTPNLYRLNIRHALMTYGQA